MSKYRIKIIKSVIGNFTWHLLKSKNNGSYCKIAEAPQMFNTRSIIEPTVIALAKSLRCEVDFYDMERDFEL